MIEHGYPELPRRGDDVAGEIQIVLARFANARGMIVREHDVGSAKRAGPEHDWVDPHLNFGPSATRHTLFTNEPQVRIQEDHMQMFFDLPLEQTCEKGKYALIVRVESDPLDVFAQRLENQRAGSWKHPNDAGVASALRQRMLGRVEQLS